MFFRKANAVFLAMVFSGIVNSGYTWPESPNKFGIMTHLSSGSFDLECGARQMQQARAISGEWGWVRQITHVGPNRADEAVRYLTLARANHLRPVLYIKAFDSKWMEKGNSDRERPKQDPDGGYTGVANQTIQWLQAIKDQGLEVPYLELWNEPNLAVEWSDAPDPREYARYHLALSKAIRQHFPQTKILNAALSPSDGTDDNNDGKVGELGDRNLNNLYFINEMMKAESELARYIDYWSSHSYPLNHPPDFKGSRYSIIGYRWELDELEKFMDRPPVIITETGYRVGAHEDRSFPAITEPQQVAWTVWSYYEAWLDDPEIVGICPFLMSDPIWKESQGWKGFLWLDSLGNPLPVADAVIALPKPTGIDYLNSNGVSLSGDVNTKDGVKIERAVVWLSPGGYADLTNENGSYQITGVPSGEYTLHLQSSGCVEKQYPITINSSKNIGASYLDYIGLAPNSGMDAPLRILDGNEHWSTEENEGRNDSKAACLTGKGKFYIDTDYLSITPHQNYIAKVWYRYEGGLREGHPKVTLEAMPFRAHSPSPIDKPVKEQATVTDNNWHQLTLTFTPTDEYTQRVRVMVGGEVQTGKGKLLFDDLMVGMEKLVGGE